jgi:hypothetical protein
MRACILLCSGLLAICWLSSTTCASAIDIQYATVVQAGAVAYEAPDPDSAAVRLLYVGEVVAIAEKVTADARDWYRLHVGGDRALYVPLTAIGPLVAAPPASVQKRVPIMRDLHPLGVGAVGYGITHGAGVQLRYLPITRAGVTLNFGPILGGSGVAGTSLSYGIAGYFMTGHFTPILELGYAFIMSEARHSRQRIQAIYLTAGLEWMFDGGLYVAVLATYFRSTRIELLFPHDAANFEVESYGPLDARGRSSLQRLLPGGIIGYGF